MTASPVDMAGGWLWRKRIALFDQAVRQGDPDTQRRIALDSDRSEAARLQCIPDAEGEGAAVSPEDAEAVAAFVAGRDGLTSAETEAVDAFMAGGL